MESTLLCSPSRDWLIVGSNGSIGSELTGALLSSIPGNDLLSAACRVHPHQAYPEHALALLRTRRGHRPLRLLFCGGKGGFSLTQENAARQHEVLRDFCHRLGQSEALEKFIFISSLGAHCSRLEGSYSHLIRSNEETVLGTFGNRSLVLRLPSIYGYNERSRRYHGLVGVMLRNMRIRRLTNIYARLETRRNYLSIHRLAPLLVRRHGAGGLLDRTGCLNIQATIGLSIFDVGTHFFRAIKQRPILKLARHSLLDEEHHYPVALAGAKFVVIDPIAEWVSLEWKRSVPLSPS